MTFIEAAKAVLEQEGRPMRSREIAEKAVALGLLSHVGKTPVQTMSARISATVAKEGSPFVRVRPGVFGLTVWKGSPPGPKKTEQPLPNEKIKPQEVAPAEDTSKSSKHPPAQAREQASLQPRSKESSVSEPESAPLPEPSIKPETDESQSAGARGGKPGDPASKRRKRKKRKPAHTSTVSPPQDTESTSNKPGPPQKSETGSTPPSPPVSKPPEQPSTRPTPPPPIEPPSPTSSASPTRETRMTNLIKQVEGVLRRNSRPIPTEKILDAVGLRGEGGPALLEALMASDALERERMGQRPRFVKHKSGYALLEREVSTEIIALENQGAELRTRLIQIAEKQLIRKLRNMPMSSFIHVMILYLQRSGFGAMVPVNFHRNGEFHLSVQDRRHQGRFCTAVVLRKDAVDFQLRERAVMDLRGALHHYDAMNGMIFTTGQVSEKAVTEGRVPNLAPVVLVDGETLAREMVQLGIGVKIRTLSLPAFDDTFFSNLEP